MIDVFATARTHLAHLENGDYTAEELLDAHLAQIARHEPQLNAVVWQDEAAARQQAKAPLSGPLAGLSMTVKEARDYLTEEEYQKFAHISPYFNWLLNLKSFDYDNFDVNCN